MDKIIELLKIVFLGIVELTIPDLRSGKSLFIYRYKPLFWIISVQTNNFDVFIGCELKALQSEFPACLDRCNFMRYGA